MRSRCARAFWAAALGILSLAPAGTARGGRWAAFGQPGWERDAPPAAGEQMIVILALKQNNADYMEERLRQVSDPAEPAYGRHMTREEVARLARPSDANIAAVREFLDALPGAWRFSKGMDLVRFVCSVRCVETAFGTRIMRQRSPVQPGSSPYRAVSDIRLPDKVTEALDGVSLNAPVFMPNRPKVRPSVSFTYPASGRIPPRLHPVMIAGDGFVSFRFVAYCKDGRPNVDRLERGICSSSIAGVTIQSFVVVALQEPSMQQVRELPAMPGVIDERDGDCGSAASCLEFNITLGVVNYANTTLMVQARYSDGSLSGFSGSHEVLPVWPLPYATPSMLSKFYGMQLSKPISHPRNIISVAEFTGQFYNPEDISTFFHLMGIRDLGETSRPVLIGRDEPIAGSRLGGEAQLDIQYIMAMAANVTTWFWSVPGMELATQQEPFLNWLMSVGDAEDQEGPLVHSVSYADQESAMPEWFKRRVNLEFVKLGLRGISVLIASGDTGAYMGDVQPKCSRSAPGFPSSSPWVTSVGGTQLAKGGAPVCNYASRDVIVTCHDEAEVVCSSARGGVITSGGGFSNDFAAPWYQQEVIRGYLQQTFTPVPSPEEWYYNTSGRGFPDISAISACYLVWMGDKLELVFGTSASTPLVAAMVAHWNEERLQKGQPPMGFLNPLLYRLAARLPEVFNDVVVGDNRCSGDMCCNAGFAAVRGWDATSGVGSPRFDAITGLIDVDTLRRMFRSSEGDAVQPSVRLMAEDVAVAPAGWQLAMAAASAAAGALLTLLAMAGACRRLCAVRSWSSGLGEGLLR